MEAAHPEVLPFNGLQRKQGGRAEMGEANGSQAQTRVLSWPGAKVFESLLAICTMGRIMRSSLGKMGELFVPCWCPFHSAP